MSLIHALRHRLRTLVHPESHARDLDEEMRFHLSLDTMHREHDAPDARAASDATFAARRRFGNLARIKEETRETAGLGVLDVARQDVRFALRTFRRTPAFTVTAILTLGLGIGANTAIFSAVDAMLLRPLPFEDPSRLVAVSLTAPANGQHPVEDNIPWSYPKFAVFRDAQTAFSDLALYEEGVAVLRGGTGDPERIYDEVAGSRYLPTLGLRPMLGRGFLPEEERLDGPRVMVLSNELWMRQFNADSGVLGRTVDLDGIPYTVVGVLPPGFRGMSGRPELWIPITARGAQVIDDPWALRFDLIARLRSGVSETQALAIVKQAGARADVEHPNPRAGGSHLGATMRLLDATRVDPIVRRALIILFAAVGLVLLIACVNVANLFLIRALGRRREIAVRLAIGAGRARLVRQLLTESVLLSALGGIAGIAVAWWGVRVLAGIAPTEDARIAQALSGMGLITFTSIRLDDRALVFTAVVALGTGVLFGLVPAWRSTRASFTDALRGDGAPTRGVTGRRADSRSTLAVLEIAFSLVLLAASGLMLRSLANLLAIDPGFRAQRVLTMRFDVPPTMGVVQDSLPGFYDQIVSRLAELPGASGAALADWPPLNGGGVTTTFAIDGRPMPAGAPTRIGEHVVTPSWFAMFHVPLRAGRVFTSADRTGAPRVAVVNEAAVRTYWPGEDPVGQSITLGEGPETATVVGVVGDVRFATLDSAPKPDVYLSYAQTPRGRMFGFVQAAGEPDAMAASVRRAMHEVAPDLPVFQMRSMDARVADATSYARLSTLLLGLFALMALVLAAMGTYAVLSFGVAQRTREIGIRTAVGATRGEITRMVVREGLGLATVGMAGGVVVAAAATRALRSLLYDVAPSDPVTFAGIVAVLTLSVVAASWIPARRAARIDPTEALRQ